MSKNYRLVLRVENPLRDTQTMSFEPGTYNITSNNIGLTEVDVLSIEQGSYTITGQEIRLTQPATNDEFNNLLIGEMI